MHLYANLFIDFSDLLVFRDPVFQHPEWQPFADSVRASHNKEVEQPQHTLLNRAVPEIVDALHASRVAVIGYQDRHAERLENKVDKMEEMLKAIINCDVPLHIEGTARASVVGVRSRLR